MDEREGALPGSAHVAPPRRLEGADVAPGSQARQPGGFFADQFENLANFRAHYCGTGPEIWAQTGGRVDAFVAAAGTGGTLAGVSCFLKVRWIGFETWHGMQVLV